MAPRTPTTQTMTAMVFQMKMTKIVILMAMALLTSVSVVKSGKNCRILESFILSMLCVNKAVQCASILFLQEVNICHRVYGKMDITRYFCN